MKKTLFAIGAMVAMVACSNDFVVKEAAQEAIGFDNAFVDNSTRSVVDPSFSNSNMFDKFHVYGYVNEAPLFDANNNGVTVTGSGIGDQGNWTYDSSKTQYWIAGADYNFNAVAPATGWTKKVATDVTNVTDATQTTLSFENNGTTDLLYATATAEGQASGNAKVGFTFRHTLSKVKFSFKNAYNASNSSIRVKDIKIMDAYKTGDVVLKAATETTPTAWSNQAKADGFVLKFGNAGTNNTATVDDNNAGDAFIDGTTLESYNELFMIPGAGATDFTVNSVAKKGYTVQFTVELLVSGQEITQYVHTIYTDFAPEPGKSYDLLAEIKPENIDPSKPQESIQFTVTEIKGWDNQAEQNI